MSEFGSDQMVAILLDLCGAANCVQSGCILLGGTLHTGSYDVDKGQDAVSGGINDLISKIGEILPAGSACIDHGGKAIGQNVLLGKNQH